MFKVGHLEAQIMPWKTLDGAGDAIRVFNTMTGEFLASSITGKVVTLTTSYQAEDIMRRLLFDIRPLEYTGWRKFREEDRLTCECCGNRYAPEPELMAGYCPSCTDERYEELTDLQMEISQRHDDYVESRAVMAWFNQATRSHYLMTHHV